MGLPDEVMNNHKRFESELSIYNELIEKALECQIIDPDDMNSLIHSGMKLVSSVSGKTMKISKILIEGIFLNLVTLWESLVEKDIISLFMQDTTNYCKKYGYELEKCISWDLAEAILIGDKYRDFKLDDAKNILVTDLNIFNKIPIEIKKIIEKMCVIRNQIAHNSRYSYNKYHKEILNNHGIKKGHIIEPYILLWSYKIEGNKTYLRMLFSSEKSMIEIYIDILKKASQSMLGNI
jgi:hypothetical protein